MKTKFISFFLLIFIYGQQLQGQAQCSITANPTSGCPPLPVTFTDNCTQPPNSCSWNFDNGVVSNSCNPGAIVYNTPGVYNVVLVAYYTGYSDTSYSQIKVFQPPIDTFTSHNNVYCVLPCDTVNFINLSIPGSSPIIEEVWNFGDGTEPDTTYNAIHAYCQQGSFQVTLIEKDENGCEVSDEVNGFVVMKPGPTANLSANNTVSCTAPLTVSFTGTGSSPNGNTSCLMYYGNGGTSAQCSAFATYPAGIYEPKLIVTDSLGCIAEDSIQINVIVIKAGFTASTVQACAGVPVTFTDTSNYASSWQWGFGDGGTSTQQNPSHIYTSTGTYTVTLTVGYDGCSGTATATNYINVTTPVNVNFSASPTASCSAPLTVNFTSNAPGATSYLWNFGDGGTSTLANPSYTYSATGTYTVSLTAYNASGCANTKTITNYISIGALQASFTFDTTHGCSPLAVKFTSTATSNVPITSYNWYFGDGNSSTQANPTHSYDSGSFSPMLIVTNAQGCKDTVQSTSPIVVGKTLIPIFTATPLIQCTDKKIDFLDQTQGTTNLTQYYWAFGDGATSIQNDPTHVYVDTGQFIVDFVVINQGCPSDTFKDTIHILPPKAKFTFTFTCDSPTFVTFSDTGVHGSIGPINYWYWEFGDSTTSSLNIPPVHHYAHQGTYFVTLVVADTGANGSGCKDSMTQKIVLSLPVAAFGASPTTGCAPLTVHFIDSSQHSTGWTWFFGDGSTSGLQNPGHVYTTPGVYSVTYIVNSANCLDSVTKTDYITVYGIIPKMGENPKAGCAPLNVAFTSLDSSYLGGTITSYQWSFGDGATSTSKNPSHIYIISGTYIVTLKATDSHGCTAIAMDTVNAITPVANFTADTIRCPGEVAHFNNLSQDANTYLWNFGDGATSTLKNPAHQYAASGYYTITLIAIDTPFTCNDTMVQVEYVHIDTPQVNFSASSTYAPCPPWPVQFTNLTGEGGLTWKWYFGDGGTSTLQNPLHVYFFPGYYNVTLVATDSFGCSGSREYIDMITIKGPIGHFEATPTSGCAPLTVTFSGTDQSAVSVVLDFGDGNTVNNIIDTTHAYVLPGTYYPIYTLTDSLNCRVSYPDDTITVGIIPYPGLPRDTSVCRGNYVAFDLPLGNYFRWTSNFPPDSNDYLSCDTCQDVETTSPDTITYYVTATTNIGCSASDTVTVNVDPLPLIFPGIDKYICPSDTLQLHAGTDVTSAVWTPNLFISDTNAVNPYVWPPIPDTTIYRVTGFNSLGCSISRVVTVFPIDRDLATVNTHDTLVCEGDTVPLLVNILQASSIDTIISWQPGNYLSRNNITDPVVTPPPGNYNYTVIVSSAGCLPDTNLVHVVVQQQPDIAAGVDSTLEKNVTVIAGSTVQLYAESHQNVAFTWFPVADSLTCTVCPNPYITVNRPQTIKVIDGDPEGCYDSAYVVLNVIYCNPKAFFVPNTFTPNGDGVDDKLFLRCVDGGIKQLEYFRVYDRWGQMMFQTKDFTQGWDGTFGGRPAAIATYVYEYQATCSNGAQVQSSGNVTLIR